MQIERIVLPRPVVAPQLQGIRIGTPELIVEVAVQILGDAVYVGGDLRILRTPVSPQVESGTDQIHQPCRSLVQAAAGVDHSVLAHACPDQLQPVPIGLRPIFSGIVEPGVRRQKHRPQEIQLEVAVSPPPELPEQRHQIRLRRRMKRIHHPARPLHTLKPAELPGAVAKKHLRILPDNLRLLLDDEGSTPESGQNAATADCTGDPGHAAGEFHLLRLPVAETVLPAHVDLKYVERQMFAVNETEICKHLPSIDVRPVIVPGAVDVPTG